MGKGFNGISLDCYGIDVIYLDYRTAFDTVSHPRLIEKLKVYGILGKLLQWIKKNFILKEDES